MSEWRSSRAKNLLRALQRIGWTIKRQTGSHKVLARNSWPHFVFAFYARDEIVPRMLARIAKRTGLQPTDLLFRQARTSLASPPP